MPQVANVLQLGQTMCQGPWAKMVAIFRRMALTTETGAAGASQLVVGHWPCALSSLPM